MITRSKRPNPISKIRKQRLKVYAQVRREYLRDNPFCECCNEQGYLDPRGRKIKATDIHHVRGKIGPLLIDKRFFKSVCRMHHNFIHLNPAGARVLGWLAPIGQWNVVPRERTSNERNNT